jgi:5'-nucleotidase (lipoprotein e(P4) family)
MAVAWFQHSAEMEALYFQGFNIATQRLDEAVAASNGAGNLAVVVDIDETMLDISPHMTTVIQSGDTPAAWAAWVEKSKAKALPGALEFANYAQSKKVSIFYISNRKANERAAVLKNLRKEGFPFADDDHLLTRDDLSFSTGDTSSKEGRRIKVAVNYDIILLIGDNLSDFAVDFEDRSVNNGKEAVETNRAQFGKKLIILPNPMYGAWEKPLLEYKDGLSAEEKTRLIKAKLKAE